MRNYIWLSHPRARSLLPSGLFPVLQHLKSLVSRPLGRFHPLRIQNPFTQMNLLTSQEGPEVCHVSLKSLRPDFQLISTGVWGQQNPGAQEPEGIRICLSKCHFQLGTSGCSLLPDLSRVERGWNSTLEHPVVKTLIRLHSNKKLI